MTWVLAIALAVAAFALAVVVFRLPRATWTTLAAALVFGLAGYTLQASPNLAGAPRDQTRESFADEWEIIPSRQLLITGEAKSRQPMVLTSDGFARRGRFEDAAGFLRNALTSDPRDFEAWVALGNALTEQADGQLTQASVYAYRQANLIRPDHPAPGYFLGLSLIRQGRMMEARSVWREALENMPADATGEDGAAARAFMADRVDRLEAMLRQTGALAPEASASEASASEAGAPEATATEAPQ